MVHDQLGVGTGNGSDPMLLATNLNNLERQVIESFESLMSVDGICPWYGLDLPPDRIGGIDSFSGPTPMFVTDQEEPPMPNSSQSTDIVEVGGGHLEVSLGSKSNWPSSNSRPSNLSRQSSTCAESPNNCRALGPIANYDASTLQRTTSKS
jgi:hypothetical protein